MVRTTIFSKTATITTGNNVDCLSLLSGDFANDAILEVTIFNDSVGADPIRISTESSSDTNAFPLAQNESIKLEMNPDILYLINTSGSDVIYRVLFKLRIVTD